VDAVTREDATPIVAAPAAVSAEPDDHLPAAVAVGTTAAAVETFAPTAAPVPSAAEPIRIEPYRLATEALQALAADAGLEWINSDAEKIRLVQAAMAAEPPAARVAREPRPAVILDDGPLVLVETRKDLSQLKLPFEAQAPSA
jgi:ribonuclease E